MTPASLTPNIGDVSTPISEVSVPSFSHLIECSSLELSRASILSVSSKEFVTDVSFQSALSDDIDKIFGLRVKYPNNPLVGFLNINILRNKIIHLRNIAEKCLPDVLLIEETKLSAEFKTEIFLLNNYEPPMRRDRNEHGGGLMLYARNGVVCNRLTLYETTSLELLCSELIVCKKKWIIFGVYRPLDSNLDDFFANLSVSLNQALDRYDNVIVMGDINIDKQDSQHPGYNKLASFCDVFGLSNLVTTKAPFTLYRIAIVAPQLSYRIGVLFTSHQSYPIQDALQIGAKITSLRR